MNAAAWARAKSLLADAADLPAGDRERFVVDHCPDLELRREVLELLVSPAPLSDIIAAGTLPPGARLGPYVVERLLGARRHGRGLQRQRHAPRSDGGDQGPPRPTRRRPAISASGSSARRARSPSSIIPTFARSMTSVNRTASRTSSCSTWRARRSRIG